MAIANGEVEVARKLGRNLAKSRCETENAKRRAMVEATRRRVAALGRFTLAPAETLAALLQRDLERWRRCLNDDSGKLEEERLECVTKYVVGLLSIKSAAGLRCSMSFVWFDVFSIFFGLTCYWVPNKRVFFF